MRAAGVLDDSRFPVVYGFDEDPFANNRSIAQMFGAIRAAFPEVRTMSALDWHRTSGNAAMDAIKQVLDVWVGGIWIDPQITPMAIKDFLASGEHKEFWWYYCIATFDSPNAHPMPWLNPTPVEWSRLHGRLLHWLAAQWGIRGML